MTFNTQIETVRQNADPLLSARAPVRAGKLTTITTSSSVLVQSIPHLYQLAQHPVVIHVALDTINGHSDYSEITAIRQCGFSFLHSEKLQEAQDLAISAHALAIRSGKGVVHFFEPTKLNGDRSISQEDASFVEEILGLGSRRPLEQSSNGSEAIYADSGHTATLQQESSDSNSSRATSSQRSARGSRSSDSDKESATTSLTSVDSEPAQKAVSSEDIYNIVTSIWAQINTQTGRQYRPFEWTGPSSAKSALFTFGADAALLGEAMGAAESTDSYTDSLLVSVRLYRPWLGSVLHEYLPKSLERVAVLEQIRRKTTKWGPLLLDVLQSLNTGSGSAPKVVGYQLGQLEPSTTRQALNGIFSNLLSESPVQNLVVGQEPETQISLQRQVIEQPELENAYMKVLNQVFSDRLHIANRAGASNVGISSQMSSTPEYGFGSLIARMEKRRRFIAEVSEAAKTRNFTTDSPQSWLSRWVLEAEHPTKCGPLADEALKRLSMDGSPLAQKLLSSRSMFRRESQWLIGSDAWAYDLGNSGVHHVLASGLNVNMLIIDSQPYSERAAADAARRKKDIGLYAMNYGNAYVASVAVYSSYTQVLEAMIEADKFNGPSVVLAYLPYNKENDSPVSVLQDTKKAVDMGYWPLYRWQPAASDKGEPNFQLDSTRLKKELEDFLARDNQLTQLMRRQPEFAANLSGSYGSEVRELQKRKAKDAYSQLLEGLYGAPMTVLFASDNGNAENLAKRLANRGKARGLKSVAYAMDEYPIEDLSSEENIVLLTSTAGQGEFPQNGRAFWDTVKNSTDLDLANVSFTVFALGDSHYWPRKEDKHYYNKPGKDLAARLQTLGGKLLIDVGMGDDQDPDQYHTGYNEWEPKLWQALNVANVEGLPDEPPPITNEDIKIESNYLRGTIVEGLEDKSTGALSAPDQQLTKFHGTYMQDDRDLRDERKAAGLEPAYSFMIRCRLPGGVATADQWLKMDALSSNLGNETMKLTTRQTFQFHGVVKGNLRPAMQEINAALMTTLAACGDVNRNVMCSSLPQHSAYHASVWEVSRKISDYLLPDTSAYHEIWLQDPDDEHKKHQIAGDALHNASPPLPPQYAADYKNTAEEQEPIYGPVYLPRKFKITVAIPPHNDTDVYAHDIGLIAIQDPKTKKLAGFNVLAGGGMGVTHNMKKTYPRTGSMLGFVKPEDTHIVCQKIMLVQRDNGDRKNRKQARLKYTMDRMGVDVFKAEVEKLWGQSFEAEREFKFESNIDTFGWQKDETGRYHFTMFIENGRIEDTAEWKMKTGLREIAKVHKGEFRLTGNQHLILSNVEEADLPTMKAMLKDWKLDNTSHSGLRLSSSACVAFPTCGLAMAESERYLPELVTKMEGVLEESGMRQDSIVMRMTGCPNGCARPWLAEVCPPFRVLFSR